MFEKFFNKPKQEQSPEPLIPDFVEEPEIQDLVSKYVQTLRNIFAYIHDGQLEKADEFKKEANDMETEHGEKMRVYLKPYMDLDKEKANSWASGNENDRRQAANSLKARKKE
jgi:hypothetical protein